MLRSQPRLAALLLSCLFTFRPFSKQQVFQESAGITWENVVLSTSFPSLPHLQPLWSFCCMIVAFSFLFFPQDYQNFFSGGTTAGPASRKGAQAVLITSSYSIWGHANIFVWRFPSWWLHGEHWVALVELGWSHRAWLPMLHVFLGICLQYCSVVPHATWEPVPLWFVLEAGCIPSQMLLKCMPFSDHIYYRLSVASFRVLSSCSKVEIVVCAVGLPLNSSPNG